MHISGSGHIAAGEYNDKISVSGSGKLDGNVRCIALSCSGAVKAVGNVYCSEDIRVSGSCHINKSASATNLSASGSLKVGENLTAEKKIKISGSLHCGGELKCTTLSCSGGIDIGGGAEAEEIKISGRVKCDGLLNAEKIDIFLEKRCFNSKIGAIGGSEIKVHSAGKPSKSGRMPLLSKFLGGSNNRLVVDELIEGDIIALECVNAPRVVGRVVAIGAGCDIGLVQYSEEIEIHPAAKVEKYEKV